MKYRLLGPVTVRSGDRDVPVGRGRQQTILAALLLDANRSVSTDRLVNVIWGDRAPATAHKQVQNSVGLLRATLRTTESDSRIESRYGSYRLEVPKDQVDSLVFRRGCGQADAAVRTGDLDRAAHALESSLGLWRGAALEDIESHLLTASANELEERRLQAFRTLVRLRFTQGRQAETIGDLLVWTWPIRTRRNYIANWPRPLHHESRTGEALRVLGHLRDRLGPIRRLP